VEFLTEAETAALVAAPDARSWRGRRDRTLLLVAAQTGLRNSELTGLRCRDVTLGTGAHVRCLGKGRKARCTPLRRDVAAALQVWLTERAGVPDAPLFPSSRGGRLSADALQRLVARHAATARRTCPTLRDKAVTPHTLRHATAMALLRRGVDLSVIALWLGHESTETTQLYLHADLRLKKQALGHATPAGRAPARCIGPPIPCSPFWRASDYAVSWHDWEPGTSESRRVREGHAAVLGTRYSDSYAARGIAVVDLAQVEHAPLHHAPARDPAGLHDAPMPVELAVFLARVAVQEHGGATVPLPASARKGVDLHYRSERPGHWVQTCGNPVGESAIKAALVIESAKLR